MNDGMLSLIFSPHFLWRTLNIPPAMQACKKVTVNVTTAMAKRAPGATCAIIVPHMGKNKWKKCRLSFGKVSVAHYERRRRRR
jgi:hypothetical protein